MSVIIFHYHFSRSAQLDSSRLIIPHLFESCGWHNHIQLTSQHLGMPIAEPLQRKSLLIRLLDFTTHEGYLKIDIQYVDIVVKTELIRIRLPLMDKRD